MRELESPPDSLDIAGRDFQRRFFERISVRAVASAVQTRPWHVFLCQR